MQLSLLDGSWIALQVRVRQERNVAEQLAVRGYDSFAPVRLRHPLKRRAADTEALFPGYVFCRYRTAYQFRIIDTPWVIRIVGIQGAPQVIEEKEIEAVRCVMQSGLRPQIWEAIPVGTRVRVCSGPFAGIEGMLIEVRNTSKLLISITAIQKHIAVEMRATDVVPIKHYPVVVTHPNHVSEQPNTYKATVSISR